MADDNLPDPVEVDLMLRDFPAVCSWDSERWFPNTTMDLTVHTLGLVGEAGEFADIVKKAMRGTLDPIKNDPDNETRKLLIEELTDVLIYIGNIAFLLQIDLQASFEHKRWINEQRFGPKEDADG